MWSKCVWAEYVRYPFKTRLFKWNTLIEPYIKLCWSKWHPLIPFSCRLSPADSTDGEASQKRRVWCHGGLPWWFIFVGWLLVIASSVVSGYYTMLYGLKFGKERSISWLVSMNVSFFQSILIVQPLKVRRHLPLLIIFTVQRAYSLWAHFKYSYIGRRPH